MILPVPADARITQLWGANPSYYQARFGLPYHNGTDWGMPQGTPLLSIADGIIVYRAMDTNGYGHYVRIYHPTLTLFSFYAHLELTDEVIPQVGENVEEAQTVGTCGSTGNSTGSHLHFEIRLALDITKYDTSPYAGIARGRVNPLTIYALLERAEDQEHATHE